jgi:hypothetical protein
VELHVALVLFDPGIDAVICLSCCHQVRSMIPCSLACLGPLQLVLRDLKELLVRFNQFIHFLLLVHSSLLHVGIQVSLKLNRSRSRGLRGSIWIQMSFDL